MQLDFTGLNTIAQKIAVKDFVEDPVETSQDLTEEANREDWVEISLDSLEELTAPIEEQNRQVEKTALISLTRQQDELKRTSEAYKTYQTNIRRSGELRADIIRGVKAGESIYSLFLKAVECISNMTGEALFNTQIEKDLKIIYGEALLEEIPLEWELDGVKERLSKLKEAYKKETTSPASKHIIELAIREHETRETALADLIEGASNTALKEAI
jgi:hypothetical protein